MTEENKKADTIEENSMESEAVQESTELTESTPDDYQTPEKDIASAEESVSTNSSNDDAVLEESPIVEIDNKEPIQVQEEVVAKQEIATANSDQQESKIEHKEIHATDVATPVEEVVSSTEEVVSNTEETQSATSDNEESDDDDVDGKHEDHDELNEEDFDSQIDYSKLNKKELCNTIADLSKLEEGYKKGKIIFAVRDAYDVIFNKEKDAALEKFVATGGDADDFEYKLDETSFKFEEYFKILKGKRTQNARELERQKDSNLFKKNNLLERLRAFVDDDENTASISDMKKLQEEWKSIGPVHHMHNRTLWANYNALLDRYYDHRNIYFELKELDRRKNLEAKELLCHQAEVLDAVENINEAIKKLNEFHEEFRHIGPIPKEKQEDIWQRFKAASDVIYSKRKEYFSHLKEEFDENLEKKAVLAEQAGALKSFTAESISDWNAKSKEVLELQKQWDAIGSMPKEKAKQVNKKFWGGFKTFFKHKSDFFKTLDSQREENLQKKKDLVEKAIQLKENEDWMATANKFKELQIEWKEIGPVPDKKHEKIYKAFKKACDDFFNKRREHSKDVESTFVDNLTKKEEICAKIEALAGNEDLQPEEIYSLQDEFNNIGFVPKKAIKVIQKRYQEALNGVVKNIKNFEADEIDELKSLISINKIKSGPHGDQKLHRKEQALKRKIQNLENDVSIWKNNLTFFANSKNASELMADFTEKIRKSEVELVELKEELKLINYVGD